MRALVISPVPSHPQMQGNSARIFNICTLLQKSGVKIDFVYADMEGFDPGMLWEMQKAWDDFHIVPECHRSKTKSHAIHYLIDDWYDERVTQMVADLCTIWDYDYVLTNYVWCSKCLEAAPPSALKLIDTHDAFGDRHHKLIEAGTHPAWFFTSLEEEAKALARADRVLAIQEEEAEYFSSISATEVRVLGPILPQYPRVWRPKTGDKLKVGYIGSGNISNQYSVRAFLDEFGRRAGLQSMAEVYLAGAICKTPASKSLHAKSLGFVDDLAVFYQFCDVVVNPNIGGSGLKIKSVEALANGVGLIATEEAMLGVETDLAEHLCRDMVEVCDALELVAREPAAAEALERASADVYGRFRARQIRNFRRAFALNPRRERRAPARAPTMEGELDG